METDEMKAEQYKTNTINIDGNNSTITSSTGLIDFDNTTIRANNMLANNFHVYGTASMDSLVVGNQLQIGNNTLFLSSDYDLNGVVNHIYTESGDLYIQSQSNDFNTIINANNKGYVGIGTDAPQQNLHIRGITQDDFNNPPNLSAVIRIEDVYISAAQPPPPPRTAYWDIAASAHRAGLFFTTDNGCGDAQTVLTLMESTGFVGIGLSNPTEKLHVRGDQSPVFMKVENDFGFTSIGFNGSHGVIESNARLQLNYYSEEDVLVGGLFYAVEYTYLAIEVDSKVGIGTTNPGNYKLAVEGSICARRVKVTEAPFGADFVFEPDYELMSLEEVENDGVDLVEMNAILLQKIEELTLYIIELEKKIER